jgi:hypothetical protein
MLAALAAIPAALLPSRFWSRYPALQIERFALASALLTVLLGFAVAIVGYFEFLRSGGASVGALYAPIVFGLTTPTGLLATYLILSGIFRTATSFVGDWYGDPLLTAIVTAATSTRERRRDTAARADRVRREGREVPDRLYSGEWAGQPQAEYVVVASRRKEEWEAGVAVITSDNTYRLGAPFDKETREGLRTIYPLLPYEHGTVIRRSIAYELPPLRER